MNNLIKLFFLLINLMSSDAGLRDKAKHIYIGSALTTRGLSDTTYTKLATEQFNCVTPENEMKWESIESHKDQYTWEPADLLVNLTQHHGMKVRGHTLLWHRALPNYVNQLKGNKKQLKKVVDNHITTEVTHFKGKIYAWDVVNEVINDDGSGDKLRKSIFRDTLGPEYIEQAYQTAHKADPNAKLYINDYSIEGINKKSTALYDFVKQLKIKGIPIHGIGFQCHIALGQIPKDMKQNLQRFVNLGLEVAITELDIRIKLPTSAAQREQQAKDYAKVVNICVSVKGCVGVTTWEFSDNYSWIPKSISGYGDALPWDDNYNAKPAVKAIENALK